MFPLSDIDLQRVLSAALEGGGQYADIFIEDTAIDNVQLQDRTVSHAQHAALYGAGIRVTCGAQTGYAYTSDLSLAALLDAARYAASIAQFATERVQPQQMPSRFSQVNPCQLTLPAKETLTAQQTIQRLMNVDASARQMSHEVRSVMCSLMTKRRSVRFANSLGETFENETLSHTRVVCIVLERDGQTQMGSATHAEQHIQGQDETTSDVALVEKAIRQAQFLFEAQQVAGGEMPVVLAAGSSGIFMHEAIGHAFEGDFIRTGESIFSQYKPGDQMFAKHITIVDDGTLPGNHGFVGIDDEGIPGQRTTLIEEGHLCQFLHDRSTAQHFGVKPTGNGRRESFRHAPIPRMRCTYMLGGDCTEEDIIRSVKRGIYARNFTNGQVQIGAGDFTFFMKEGYLIEDGRLTTPLRDMNIIGNGPQALRDISMVANNLRIDTSAGMCGKGGQRVPVSQGLPTVKVDKLTIG